MITNGEARDKYKEDYEKASKHYSDISSQSENYQAIISEGSGKSQQLEEELRNIQESIDLFTDFLSTCQTIKDEDYEDENHQIKEYANTFQNSITHSQSSIDIESYYVGNMRNLINFIDTMIEKIKAIINSLETKKKDAADRKLIIDEDINTARVQLNNLDSKGAVSARIEESYQWYRYYLNKCEEEGEDVDSGL